VSQIATGYHNEGSPEFHDVSATVLLGERAASQVLSPDGKVLLTYGDEVSVTPLLRRAEFADVTRRRTVRPDAASGGFRIAAERTTRRGHPVIVVAAESMAPVESSVHKVVTLLLLACPMALLLTAFGGWWIARRALRPVEQMTHAAMRIEVERLDEHLNEPRTRDELADLARTLNAMLDRIRSAVGQQRRLVDDASHELRTPLAAMRSELDVSLRADDLTAAGREVLESVRDEVDRLSRILDDLLTLASADEGTLALATEDVQLDALAGRAGEAMRPLAARRSITIAVDGTPITVAGDPERLRQALGNLVENAVKFSPAGGVVGIRTASHNGSASVTVSDDGPGVAEGDRERIFERFFRADGSRTRGVAGSGLGLSIALEIIEAHGGRIRFEPREPHGSEFTIELNTGPVSP
jgi:heavy metal sensor kinase